jgi:hypothetical protein
MGEDVTSSATFQSIQQPSQESAKSPRTRLSSATSDSTELKSVERVNPDEAAAGGVIEAATAKEATPEERHGYGVSSTGAAYIQAGEPVGQLGHAEQTERSADFIDHHAEARNDRTTQPRQAIACDGAKRRRINPVPPAERAASYSWVFLTSALCWGENVVFVQTHHRLMRSVC